MKKTLAFLFIFIIQQQVFAGPKEEALVEAADRLAHFLKTVSPQGISPEVIAAIVSEDQSAAARVENLPFNPMRDAKFKDEFKTGTAIGTLFAIPFALGIGGAILSEGATWQGYAIIAGGLLFIPALLLTADVPRRLINVFRRQNVRREYTKLSDVFWNRLEANGIEGIPSQKSLRLPWLQSQLQGRVSDELLRGSSELRFEYLELMSSQLEVLYYSLLDRGVQASSPQMKRLYAMIEDLRSPFKVFATEQAIRRIRFVEEEVGRLFVEPVEAIKVSSGMRIGIQDFLPLTINQSTCNRVAAIAAQ